MKKYFSALTAYWEAHPLRFILILAFAVRLLAVFFAKGWGMLDDHFLVIEVAQSWADGKDVNHWLPWTPGNTGPEGHSFLYVGIHYLIFLFFKFTGLQDPQMKMWFIRFIHAAWSMLVVYYGYRISLRISGLKTARVAGLLLAAYWFAPWSSVRNLVEIAAIPLLIVGTWILISANDKKYPVWQFIWGGFLMGLSFSVRYQTGIYAAGAGFALIWQKQFKQTFWFSIGVLASVLLIQGGIDMAIWGRPFAEMGEYVQYNIDHKYNFIKSEWYSYILLLSGILIPPVSFFILFGLFYKIKNRLILFFPVVFFLAFHIYFPNKQERFILTIIPSLIIAGMAGWHLFYENSLWWKTRQKLYNGFVRFFWILNGVLLLVLSTMYSKKSRVEAMYHLSRYPEITEIIIENTNADKADIMPQFYAGQAVISVEVTRNRPFESYRLKSGIIEENSRFVLFVGDNNLEKRKEEISKVYKNLVFETKIEPGLLDIVMYKLNPARNTNQTIFIYRNRNFFPDPR